MMTTGINRRSSLAVLGAALLPDDTRTRSATATLTVARTTFADLPAVSLAPDTGLVTTSGYEIPGIGGGDYVAVQRPAPFIATRWRRQSRDGQWFEKDERYVDLLHMGARADGGDATTALLAAFAWLNQQPGRQLHVPRGSFRTLQDLVVTSDNASVLGTAHSASEIVLSDGASLRLGKRQTTGTGPGGKLLRQVQGKVLFARLQNFALKATGTHTQDCLVLDHADNAFLHLLDISHFKTVADVSIGAIRTRWVQWTSFDHVFTNTNSTGLTVELANETDENEDHFLIHACQFYIGKRPRDNAVPACVKVECSPGRSAPLWNFHISGRTHLLGWKAPDNLPATTGPIYSSGILLIQPNRGSAFRMMTVRDTFFEDVSYPIDLHRGVTGEDISTVHTSGCTFMESRTVFSGRDWSKHSITAANNHYINGGYICDGGVRMYHSGFNRSSGMAGVDRQGDLSKHQWERKSLCLEGVQLECKGRADVPPGSRTMSIQHNLSWGLMNDLSLVALSATWAAAGPRVQSLDRSHVVVAFDRPPAEGETLFYHFEI